MFKFRELERKAFELGTQNAIFPLSSLFVFRVPPYLSAPPLGCYHTPEELGESRALSTSSQMYVLIFHTQSVQVASSHSSGKVRSPNHMIGGARRHAAITHLQPLELYIRVKAKARLAASFVLLRAERPHGGPAS